ncbi:agmatine deiminase family protein [Spongiibacter taiwanensis]|uniref:agmatine deiminase family protein n=1 Tax=Spongiibacter taiwanensis TaxID=1748242 RepID=UPI002034ABE0|nr:agmatine deiminase family protein [Spongiibacter taiwanensis]USA42688.1 agmatine deiminase family protein [Spongiibacter taiwanensis]
MGAAMHYLPPEWYVQDTVILSWPHADTDWAAMLSEVEAVYTAVAGAILKVQGVLVLCHDQELEQRVRRLLAEPGAVPQNLLTAVVPYNDTWVRDYGPLTVVDAQGRCRALDFTFTGWGGKYDGGLDNAVNRTLLPRPMFAAGYQSAGLVLEGGGVDVDGNGHLLTTSRCLENSNRNPQLSRAQIEACLRGAFGIHTVFWLEHGHLEGDDTDAHIDTLARFAPNSTIVYTACDDPSDSHYKELLNMAAELKALRRQDGKAFRLLALPWPTACYNRAGERLPASYANFLVINGAVLVPTYRQRENDARALSCVGEAFPDHRIIGMDCLPLIHQFGSLHCISMQVPRGFLK